jgi:hypothetical protein
MMNIVGTFYSKYAVVLAAVGSLSFLGCSVASAEDVVRDRPGPDFGNCTTATVDQLWADPWLYRGKRVCVAGYLRRMVPYGEESAALVDRREDARGWRTDRYVTLSVKLTPSVQEALSKNSETRLDAVGVFAFDATCSPDGTLAGDGFRCSPDREMQLLDPVIAHTPDHL